MYGDVQDYHIAVHADHLKYWFIQSAEPLWVDIEKVLNKTHNLCSILYVDSWRPLKQPLIPPATTLLAWRAVTQLTLSSSQHHGMNLLLITLTHLIK